MSPLSYAMVDMLDFSNCEHIQPKAWTNSHKTLNFIKISIRELWADFDLALNWEICTTIRSMVVAL